jgi:hypothetical protein
VAQDEAWRISILLCGMEPMLKDQRMALNEAFGHGRKPVRVMAY